VVVDVTGVNALEIKFSAKGYARKRNESIEVEYSLDGSSFQRMRSFRRDEIFSSWKEFVADLDLSSLTGSGRALEPSSGGSEPTSVYLRIRSKLRRSLFIDNVNVIGIQ